MSRHGVPPTGSLGGGAARSDTRQASCAKPVHQSFPMLQYRDGTHIRGELDVEEHIVYFKELTGYIKQQQQQHTNLNDTEWERECRFSVRSVVHTVTAILVEFESNHMGFEVFKVLSTKGYICDSKEMQVMLARCRAVSRKSDDSGCLLSR